jgi:hypothetical protein
MVPIIFLLFEKGSLDSLLQSCMLQYQSLLTAFILVLQYMLTSMFACLSCILSSFVYMVKIDRLDALVEQPAHKQMS